MRKTEWNCENPDCAAQLAVLDERSVCLAQVLERVEGKVDTLSERVWGIRLKLAVLAAGSGGGAAILLKLFHIA
jgi:hypothetical protein